MSPSLQQLERAAPPELATSVQNAGIAGAGGAGFPAHAKWRELDEVPYLLMNHQESEPNYYIDKWLGRENVDEYATFFDALLEDSLELVVVGAKEKDRNEWMRDLEAATNATVYTPDELPLDPTEEDGVVFSYTEDRYEYGMESVILRLVADIALRDELPMDHGWIVQNTETMYNIYQALAADEPVTHKYVHVDGNVPRHRFLKVPIGTPASTLLAAAEKPLDELNESDVLADGGPGWCFEIEKTASEFGVRKRTNCILVLDEDEVAENTLGDDRINVLDSRDWSGDHETEPTILEPDVVRIPLISNPGFGHVLARSHPIVEPGEDVERGEMIATPGQDGISNTQHATIDGTVSDVTDTHIEIRPETGSVQTTSEQAEDEWLVHWTWCAECGSYIPRPDLSHLEQSTKYVCEDCR